MTSDRPPLAIALSLGLLAAPAPALAQAALPDSNATARTRLIHPMSLTKLEDLDFGGVSVTTAGTVVVNPNTNAVTTTGGALRAGGDPHPALFMGSAVKKTVVIIRIPKAPITLRRVGGTETMTVTNWTLQGQDKKELAANSSFTFAVGATLNVAANQAEGVYEGSFSVEVQYP